MSHITRYFCDVCSDEVPAGKPLHRLDVRVNCPDRYSGLTYGSTGDAKLTVAFSKELCQRCYDRAKDGVEALRATLWEMTP